MIGCDFIDHYNIEIKELNEYDIRDNLLKNFNRYQEVKKVWRNENNKKVIKNANFIEFWDYNKKQIVIKDLKRTLVDGGTVIGVFKDNKLVGFSSIGLEISKENNKYVQLLQLQISYKFRNKGIGKTLFLESARKAKKSGAKKLYISAHSSIESMGFYIRMNCIDATWLYKKQVQLEPCDFQLEYVL